MLLTNEETTPYSTFAATHKNNLPCDPTLLTFQALHKPLPLLNMRPPLRLHNKRYQCHKPCNLRLLHKPQPPVLSSTRQTFFTCTPIGAWNTITTPSSRSEKPDIEVTLPAKGTEAVMLRNSAGWGVVVASQMLAVEEGRFCLM